MSIDLVTFIAIGWSQRSTSSKQTSPGFSLAHGVLPKGNGNAEAKQCAKKGRAWSPPNIKGAVPEECHGFTLAGAADWPPLLTLIVRVDCDAAPGLTL